MVDILGPSGQPLQPNPFQQGQSSLPLNTSAAQKAMADLQKSLEGLLGSFRNNWDKATQERLRAEETFFRSVDKLSKSNHANLLRQKDEYISKIKQEANAQIEAEQKKFSEGKRTAEELATFQIRTALDVSKKVSEAEREVTRKRTEELKKSGFLSSSGQFLGQVGGQVGGVHGAAISGVGSALGLLANPAFDVAAIIGLAVAAAFKIGEQEAQKVRIGASLAAGGLGIAAGGAAAAGIERGGLFGPLFGTALGAKEQEKLVGTMAGSPQLLKDATTSNKDFLDTMGLFANVMPDSTDIIKEMVKESTSLGMSFKQMQQTFANVRVNQYSLNSSFQDTLTTQLAMQKSLRNLTSDTGVAASLINNLGTYFDKIKASPEERQRMATGFASSIANLSLSQIVGMAGFVGGGKLPTHDQLFGGANPLVGAGTPGLLGNFLSKVAGQAGPRGSLQADLVADQLRQQFLQGSRLQDVGSFFQAVDALKGGKITSAQFSKKFETLEKNTPQGLMADGIQKLGTVLGPEGQFEKFLSAFFTKMIEDLEIIAGKKEGPGLSKAKHIVAEITGAHALKSVAKRIVGTSLEHK